MLNAGCGRMEVAPVCVVGAEVQHHDPLRCGFFQIPPGMGGAAQQLVRRAIVMKLRAITVIVGPSRSRSAELLERL